MPEGGDQREKGKILGFESHARNKRKEEKMQAAKELANLKTAGRFYGMGLESEKTSTTEAIEDYTKALEYDPNHKEACLNLGALCQRKNEFKKAEEFYKRAIDIDRSYALAWRNLGILYSETSRRKEGIEALKEAVKFKPDYWDAWINLGLAQETLGLHMEAMVTYRFCLNKCPEESFRVLAELGAGRILERMQPGKK